MVLSVGVGAARLWGGNSYSIGWYNFGFGSVNYPPQHVGKACILIAAPNDGLNASMFCYVLDWTDHLLLRRYEYQCSDCWSCYCHLPDKDSPRIGGESAQHKELNRKTQVTSSILVGGNSNSLKSHMEWFGLAQLDAPQ